MNAPNSGATTRKQLRDQTDYDLVIIGSGISGLFAALQTRPSERVLIVTKGELQESNTQYAQGGIAAALTSDDSPELHCRDTILAGDGLCDPEAVAALTSEAEHCIKDLLDLGVPFDRELGDLARTLEGAHSAPRVLHAGGDATGGSIVRALSAALADTNVQIWEHTRCTSIDVEDGRVRGAFLVRADGQSVHVAASHVLLATGGAGQVFSRTTNPSIATGDGIALAFKSGAELMDLEFMQFHPTAFCRPGAPAFLISEAVRGEGAILRDASGLAFMERYHGDRELAPRDVVARAIHGQMETTGEPCMWLDLAHLGPALVERRFPTILEFCRKWGIDPVTQPIPVAPAAHYLMGGVRTDVQGRTSLPGLLASGEVACTGVHGANRLASNSLLEGLVFARRAIGSMRTSNDVPHLPWTLSVTAPPPPPAQISGTLSRADVSQVMWQHAGLIRSAGSLQHARAAIGPASAMQNSHGSIEPSNDELENLGIVASLMISAALFREESRGAHFRTDFPHRDSSWQQHTVISSAGIGTAPLAQLEPAGAGRHG